MTARLLAAEVFVVIFGLARLIFNMGEARMVMHGIVAVARRRLREKSLILLQLRRTSPVERQRGTNSLFVLTFLDTPQM